MNSFGSHTIPWEGVERFESSQTIPRSRVLLVSKNGAVMPIVGTAQGSLIIWDDGETNDIVAELNQRLGDLRAQGQRSDSQTATPTALG